jgi:hypothetical protein
MFVLELYFIFYRVPKMMTHLARERKRSALRWSLLGAGAWVGAEFIVLFGSGMLYGIGAIVLGWPMPVPVGVTLIAYVLALGAALASTTIVSRILTLKPKEELFRTPPPPPDFHSESNRAI